MGYQSTVKRNALLTREVTWMKFRINTLSGRGKTDKWTHRVLLCWEMQTNVWWQRGDTWGVGVWGSRERQQRGMAKGLQKTSEVICHWEGHCSVAMLVSWA